MIRRLARCWLAMAVLVLPIGVSAATPQDMVDRGELTVSTALSPDTGIVPGQHLRLLIEVATTRWFTGGTRINIPEVPGLVILQTEQFASNASEQRGGETWVIQRWSLDVYPQREGEFSIPPVSLAVSVNAGGSDSASGEITAPGIRFDAALPPALEGIEHWVAAPDFSVRQSFDRDLTDLAVGDAVERTVRFEARDVMAMMLPELPEQATEGVAAYPLPPSLENRSNRGVATAQRIERVSYVMQAEGDFRLPELEFAWWNTTRNELEFVTVPAMEFTVAAGAATRHPMNRETLVSMAWGLLALALTAALAVTIVRLTPSLPWHRVSDSWVSVRARLRELRQPALPERLNPGSSAGEKTASGSR